MPIWLTAIIIGIVAGGVAAFVMALYQNATKSLFGQNGGGTPATEKAADTASAATTGHYVPGPKRPAAGNAMHYALGVALGVFYVVVALGWTPITFGYGAAFGVATMLVIDDLVVPLAGWGKWPTTLAVNLYSLTSHLVFGVVLEGLRRVAWSLVG